MGFFNTRAAVHDTINGISYHAVHDGTTLHDTAHDNAYGSRLTIEAAQAFVMIFVSFAAIAGATWQIIKNGKAAINMVYIMPFSIIAVLFAPLFFKKIISFVSWCTSNAGKLVFQAMLCVGLYGIGITNAAAPGTSGENYFFTFGAIAALIFWRSLILTLKPWLMQNWNDFAGIIFNGRGSHYFAGTIVLLLMTALMVSVGLEPIAEQFAIICYFMLVAGVCLECVEIIKMKKRV